MPFYLPAKKRIVFGISMFLSFVFMNAEFRSAQAEPPEGYKLVWGDEFDGNQLDLKKWTYRGLGPRRKAVNTKDCITLDGKGHLLITTKREGDEVHTGMIATNGIFETTFGYFECRVKFQDQPGHWSAFWLQSPTVNKVGDPKENGTEIDIFEYLVRYPTTMHQNLHWDGYGKEHKTSGKKTEIKNLPEDFHTIGLLWTPEEYVFYVDGVETFRSKEAVSHRSEYIILSQEVDSWGGPIEGVELPDSSVFDYVRVYQKAAAEVKN